MASGGREKYRKVCLDGSWDGRQESLAGWNQPCRLTWESMGLGKVRTPPRWAPAGGPKQTHPSDGPLDGSWYSVALEPVLELALVDQVGLELTEICLPRAGI